MGQCPAFHDFAPCLDRYSEHRAQLPQLVKQLVVIGVINMFYSFSKMRFAEQRQCYFPILFKHEAHEILWKSSASMAKKRGRKQGVLKNLSAITRSSCDIFLNASKNNSSSTRLEKEPFVNSWIVALRSSRNISSHMSVNSGSTPMRVQNEFVENSRIAAWESARFMELK